MSDDDDKIDNTNPIDDHYAMNEKEKKADNLIGIFMTHIENRLADECLACKPNSLSDSVHDCSNVWTSTLHARRNLIDSLFELNLVNKSEYRYVKFWLNDFSSGHNRHYVGVDEELDFEVVDILYKAVRDLYFFDLDRFKKENCKGCLYKSSSQIRHECHNSTDKSTSIAVIDRLYCQKLIDDYDYLYLENWIVKDPNVIYNICEEDEDINKIKIKDITDAFLVHVNLHKKEHCFGCKIKIRDEKHSCQDAYDLDNKQNVVDTIFKQKLVNKSEFRFLKFWLIKEESEKINSEEIIDNTEVYLLYKNVRDLFKIELRKFKTLNFSPAYYIETLHPTENFFKYSALRCLFIKNLIDPYDYTYLKYLNYL